MTGSGVAGKAAWWLWLAAIGAGTAAIALGIPGEARDSGTMAAMAWAFGGLAFFLWLASGIFYRWETTATQKEAAAQREEIRAQQKVIRELMERACGQLGVDTKDADATVTPMPRRHAG